MLKLLMTLCFAGTLLTTACTVSPNNFEAEKTPIETAKIPNNSAPLNTYTEPNIPVTAQYPENITVSSSGSSEGVGVFFRFKPQGNALDTAEIHVFLPTGVATATEQEPFVTGSNGLVQNNGWQVDQQRTQSDQFAYPWVKQVLDISTDQEQTGHILLGEVPGQAIQVVLLYPAEMADSFWPAATTVLDTLQFKSPNSSGTPNNLGRQAYRVGSMSPSS
jgi:hypothetical protein